MAFEHDEELGYALRALRDAAEFEIECTLGPTACKYVVGLIDGLVGRITSAISVLSDGIEPPGGVQ